jgi:hypothetical protein
MEKATKVSEITIRRILGEQKKHEAQRISLSMFRKTYKVPRHRWF